MKLTKQTTLTSALLICLALTMTACGSSQSSSTDLASRTTITTTGDGATQNLALCNAGSNSTVGLKSKAFQQGTSVYMDRVVVKLTSLPSGFGSNESYLSFFKWLANTSGSSYIAPSPLLYYLVDNQTSKVVQLNKSTLSWNDVSAHAASLGINDPVTFFNRVSVIIYLGDSSSSGYSAADYDVLRVAAYNSSTNSTTGFLDTLLPIFAANPSDYAYESNGATRASVLTNLHPLKSKTSEGWTSAQYVTMANSFCF